MTSSDFENSHLDQLENESIYILREAFATLPHLAALWSMGKDSTVMLWLARKAFFGRVPFPVIHIDTTFKFPEMIAFRDRMAKEWGLNLVVRKNATALSQGMNEKKGRLQCCTALKTEGLKGVIAEKGYRALLTAIRRDEEGSRGKERVFSPRDHNATWEYRDQPPELWNQYQAALPPGGQMRVHPILSWTELDIWRYVRREKIPMLSLYFARDGRRYRSVGCMPCTAPVESSARDLDEIIEELRTTQIGERSGRAQDKADRYALQKLRREGYM